MTQQLPATPLNNRRAGCYTGLLLLINLVADGFSGRPAGIVHQVFVLPVTFAFLFLLYKLLWPSLKQSKTEVWNPQRALFAVLGFELAAAAVFFYETRHYAAMGYRLHPAAFALTYGCLIIALVVLMAIPDAKGFRTFLTASGCYAGGLILAILSFPLNYLRSDMLPVILWGNTNLLHHTSPYQTMHVAGRVYDFPYLPGMLLAYLPFVAAHLDLRWASILFVLGTGTLIFFSARREHRREVEVLLALFLTCPYLQYRHELYNQPHWFALVASLVFMQRRRFVWAAVALGISMSIYQFSWIIFPFFVLNGFRRKGLKESAKLAAAALSSALVITGPFLSSAYGRIASNTVSQWGLRLHADANPINLSYWATYIVRPDKLLSIQAAMMAAIFLYCVATKRCSTVVDTVRWMLVALTVFILFNVLVDGYFYLMLLVPLLVYTCMANGWWSSPDEAATDKAQQSAAIKVKT